MQLRALGAVYFIPGVGQVALGITIAIAIGIAIGAATYYAKKKIKSKAKTKKKVKAKGKSGNKVKEHRTNRRKSNWDKHTKRRAGRLSEKKKQKDSWIRRK